MSIVKAAVSVMDSPSADSLNANCNCSTLNTDKLNAHFSDASQTGISSASIFQSRPHLFSSSVVFISQRIQEQIQAVVSCIERVASLPAYQAQALSRVDSVAMLDFGPRSACMGYDFHLGTDAPQLIEINTNAGGAMLNLALAASQDACVNQPNWSHESARQSEMLEKDQLQMFVSEWKAQRSELPLGRILIVDDDPHAQYLAPEFELYRQLFHAQGIHAAIADGSALQWQDGHLMYQGEVVDMVYNRLTDFYLTESKHAALRHAYEAGAVVLTPHPRAHALLADKRNLITLSQTELLASWGVTASDQQLLAQCVPSTQMVTADRADELWSQRRQFFFKPVAGYGAKATYRGDKLTRRVWSDILAGEFVAQQLVAPNSRQLAVDGVLTELKFDLRAYAYAGQVQFLAARLYAGQTTNFRTPGGGFAPVVVVPSKGLD